MRVAPSAAGRRGAGEPQPRITEAPTGKHTPSRRRTRPTHPLGVGVTRTARTARAGCAGRRNGRAAGGGRRVRRAAGPPRRAAGGRLVAARTGWAVALRQVARGGGVARGAAGRPGGRAADRVAPVPRRRVAGPAGARRGRPGAARLRRWWRRWRGRRCGARRAATAWPPRASAAGVAAGGTTSRHPTHRLAARPVHLGRAHLPDPGATGRVPRGRCRRSRPSTGSRRRRRLPQSPHAVCVTTTGLTARCAVAMFFATFVSRGCRCARCASSTSTSPASLESRRSPPRGPLLGAASVPSGGTTPGPRPRSGWPVPRPRGEGGPALGPCSGAVCSAAVGAVLLKRASSLQRLRASGE